MRRYRVTVNDQTYVLDVEETGSDRFTVLLDDRMINVRLDEDHDLAQAVVTRVDGATPTPGSVDRPPPPERSAPAAAPAASPATGSGVLRSPMPGTVVSVEVEVGSVVERSDTVIVVEAMKMKNSLRAPASGEVSEVMVRAGQQVRTGDPLLRVGSAS